MDLEPQQYADMPRVVCITQLAAPTERVIGPFPADTGGPMGDGGESHKWITDHLSGDWIRITDMPLEVPESDHCPLCGTRRLPRSLGMGHGPADLSEREGFGDE